MQVTDYISLFLSFVQLHGAQCRLMYISQNFLNFASFQMMLCHEAEEMFVFITLPLIISAETQFLCWLHKITKYNNTV